MGELASLLKVEIENRDEFWERRFLEEFPKASVRVLKPDPQQGPDHWPYLWVATGEGADDTAFDVLRWLSARGIGLVVNPEKPLPDFVLSYGMIWNFRERGQLLTPLEAALPEAMTDESSLAGSAEGRSATFEVREGQEVWTGVPSAVYLPAYVRSILKQFLADQGIFAPKVSMISLDKVNYDLCFSIESLKGPPAHEHAGIAEALSWFLPTHYSVSLVSEKVISGFQPL